MGLDGRNEDPRGDYSFSVAVRRMDGTQAVVRRLHQLSSLLFSCGYISCDLTPPPPPLYRRSRGVPHSGRYFLKITKTESKEMRAEHGS